MKVPSDPGSSPPPPTSGEAPATDSKPFEKVLESKKDGWQARRARGQKTAMSEGEADLRAAWAADASALPPLRNLAPAAAKTPESTSMPRSLDGLVQEILVVSGPGVDPKVEVQFQSKTLEGLHVKITRKGDEVSIRLLTGSDSVAQLLSRNTAQLSEALLAKGLHVAPIQVELAPASARTAETGSDQNRGGDSRGRGDERQDRRHR